MVNKHLNILASALCFFIVIYVTRLVLINNEGFKSKAKAPVSKNTSAVLNAARETKAKIEKEKIIERERQRARQEEKLRERQRDEEIKLQKKRAAEKLLDTRRRE
jgi:hypothetical protein